MSETKEKYLDERKVDDINTIKTGMADNIINDIRTNDLDYQTLTSELGVSEQEFLEMLVKPTEFAGSELFLMGQNVRKRVQPKANKL